MQPLKLIALDADDLAILSAHVQDAVLKVRDIAYFPGEKRFVVAMNRFAWSGDGSQRQERRRTVLHFERVSTARQRNIRRDAGEAVLNLLAVTFAEGDAPAGTVSLVFSGGGEIQLDVECVEARLADLGAAWKTANQPRHDLSDDAAAARPEGA